MFLKVADDTGEIQVCSQSYTLLPANLTEGSIVKIFGAPRLEYTKVLCYLKDFTRVLDGKVNLLPFKISGDVSKEEMDAHLLEIVIQKLRDETL